MGFIEHKIGNYKGYIYTVEVIDLQFKNDFKMNAGSMISAVLIFFKSEIINIFLKALFCSRVAKNILF